MAPVTATMLAVSPWSPMATRRPPGRPAGGAGAQQPDCLAAEPPDRVPTGPAATLRWPRADACGGDRLAEHPDRAAEVVQQRFESQLAHEVGRGKSGGVTRAAPASA
ncbi:MAG TPA: hypothetical protein VG123_09775 [Streptosporangiaceae bacterium]|nr:hypothetical protein [Streptosporangiaceae bacterium]